MTDRFTYTDDEIKAGETGLVKARQTLDIARARITHTDPFTQPCECGQETCR